jgi:hypothetical protein
VVRGPAGNALATSPKNAVSLAASYANRMSNTFHPVPWLAPVCAKKRSLVGSEATYTLGPCGKSVATFPVVNWITNAVERLGLRMMHVAATITALTGTEKLNVR